MTKLLKVRLVRKVILRGQNHTNLEKGKRHRVDDCGKNVESVGAL
jgi:hypothetical protein